MGGAFSIRRKGLFHTWSIWVMQHCNCLQLQCQQLPIAGTFGSLGTWISVTKCNTCNMPCKRERRQNPEVWAEEEDSRTSQRSKTFHINDPPRVQVPWHFFISPATWLPYTILHPFLWLQPLSFFVFQIDFHLAESNSQGVAELATTPSTRPLSSNWNAALLLGT